MKKIASLSLTVVLFTFNAAFAESPKSFKSLSQMPIQEITVFKDGHAFVLHSGKMDAQDSFNQQQRVSDDYSACLAF
jgi:hypothetical protein